MRLDKVIIGKGEMELLLQALTLLGKGNGPSDQAAVVMTHCQVVTLNKAGVDVTAHRGTLEAGGNRPLGAEDDTRADVNHPSALSTLDYLGVEQVFGRLEPRLARPSRPTSSRELVLEAISFQQGIVVVLQFVRSKQGHVSIRAGLDASD